MRSLIASSIMRTGSISPARACAEPASNKIKKLDQLASRMTKNESASEARDPGGIIPLRWAASSRNPGRHYPVIPGRLRRNPHVKMQMRDRRMVGRLAVSDCRISTDLLRSMSFLGAASGPHGLHQGLGTQDGDHTLQIVGQNVEAHLCSDLFEGSGL